MINPEKKQYHKQSQVPERSPPRRHEVPWNQ